MATIISSNSSITEADVARLTNWQGGDLGTNVLGSFNTLVVTATPTEFSYTSFGFRASAFNSGTGVDLVYDEDNVPVSGTITGLSLGVARVGSGAGGPGSSASLTVRDLDISVEEALQPGFAISLLGEDNDIFLDREDSGFLSGTIRIEAGNGDDVIQQNNEGLDFSLPNSAARSPVFSDAGAGSDRVLLEPEGFNETIRLGSGVDAIVLNSYSELPQNAPTRIVEDFNPAEDRVELLPFTQGSRVYEVVNFEGNAVIRSVSVNNPADIRDALILENVDATTLEIVDGVVQANADFVPQQPVFGTEGADVLFGNPFPNTLIGLGGDDTIISFEANDVLIGGEGNDSLDGGAGNDQLFGEAGDDRLFGASGNDAVFGGAGNDFIIGDDGDDGLFGGTGNDTIFGGNGNDYIEAGDGFNEINGENGEDTILGGAGVDIILGGFGDDNIIGGAANDVILGESNDDTLDGGSGDDSVDGGFGNDVLLGNLGNDTLFGAQGNDELFGGAGNDTLFGGDGADRITAGAGTDLLSGEDGGDVFLFGSNDGFNFVCDYQDGVDLLNFTGDLNSNGQVNIFSTLDGTGTYISFDQTEVILEGVDASLFTTDDFGLVLPQTAFDAAATPIEIELAVEADMEIG